MCFGVEFPFNFMPTLLHDLDSTYSYYQTMISYISPINSEQLHNYLVFKSYYDSFPPSSLTLWKVYLHYYHFLPPFYLGSTHSSEGSLFQECSAPLHAVKFRVSVRVSSILRIMNPRNNEPSEY